MIELTREEQKVLDFMQKHGKENFFERKEENYIRMGFNTKEEMEKVIESLIEKGIITVEF